MNELNSIIESLKRGSSLKDGEIMKLMALSKGIVDAAPLSILTIDKDGFILFTNKYYKQISANKSPIGKNIFKSPFFIREGLCPYYKKLLNEGVPFKKENCVSMDGSEYINIIALPIKDENGGIGGAVSMAVDVTETVKAKLEVVQLNKDLENKVVEKTKQLLEINRQLKESLRLKTQFVSDASHELRTPLSIAKLNLEFFRRQYPGDTDSAEILSTINSEMDKIADILSDIAFFTAIDEDTVKIINLEKINLNELLKNFVGRMEPMAATKNINIFFKKDSANPEIQGDRFKLEKLFSNLVGNSIKYGKKNGWIKISLECEKDEIKIIISDNGIGILKKDLPHIFKRFYRADLSKKTGEGGFGLGLSICKWIVDQHGGKIDVESKVGKGSVFTICVPSVS